MTYPTPIARASLLSHSRWTDSASTVNQVPQPATLLDLAPVPACLGKIFVLAFMAPALVLTTFGRQMIIEKKYIDL